MPAIMYVRAGVLTIVFLLIWMVGNVVIFGAGGVNTVVDNISPALVTTDYFGGISEGVKYFWGLILPILFLGGIAVYILLASHMWEPLGG